MTNSRNQLNPNRMTTHSKLQKMKATLTIFDNLDNKEIKFSVSYKSNPKDAVMRAISSHKKDIGRFCLFGEYSVAITSDETGEVLYNGDIECNAVSGMFNLKMGQVS